MQKKKHLDHATCRKGSVFVPVNATTGETRALKARDT